MQDLRNENSLVIQDFSAFSVSALDGSDRRFGHRFQPDSAVRIGARAAIFDEMFDRIVAATR